MVDYLLLGHITHDDTPQGPQLGGTISYSGVVARAMGLRVAAVTSAHPDDPVLAQLPDIEIHLIPAESSTIFVNVYAASGERTQHTRGQAAPLSYGDIPDTWRSAPIVHLAPLVAELDDTLRPERFPGALVAVTPQGWMRAWDERGRVRPVPWANAAEILPAAAVTVLSDEDLGFSETLERQYAELASRLVVTRGYRGATLYTHGARQDFAALKVPQLCHPTGAGDVFAAALLAHLFRQPDAWAEAMQVAVNVASVFVETCGDPGAPTLSVMQKIVADARVQAAMA